MGKSGALVKYIEANGINDKYTHNSDKDKSEEQFPNSIKWCKLFAYWPLISLLTIPQPPREGAVRR